MADSKDSNRNQHLPKLGTILAHDTFSTCTASLIGTAWIGLLLLVLVTIDSQANETERVLIRRVRWFGLWVAIVLTILLGSTLKWRIRLFRRLFQEGILIDGMIETIRLYKKGSAKVEFQYELSNRQFHSRVWISKEWLLHFPQKGDFIKVVVDPAKPRRAFLYDLFLSHPKRHEE